MSICRYCGGEIVFRYIDGQSTPIHINGGQCTGYPSAPQQSSARPFESIVSYLNPNAHCPVCGETVYFYQSPYGGRVFFDDVGWPWPKHGCTDNPKAQTESVKLAGEQLRRAFFLSKSGKALRLYRIVDLIEESRSISVKFSEVGQQLMAFRISISTSLLEEKDVTLTDLQNAPAFVVQFHDNHRTIEFISDRKKKIESLKVLRERDGD